MATRVEVLVIGAGDAGLAASCHLARRGIEHLVLERGAVGESWRSRRWNSFHLVTPNWCCRLPGAAAIGQDPDGFMTARELTSVLERYAESIGAPVWSGVHVASLRRVDRGYLAETDDDRVRARSVVVATGAYQRAWIPDFGARLGPGVLQLASDAYRHPDQLPGGGVLVVGSGQSGVQIADELLRSGRRVHLSVGGCGWVPRRYRGRDIARWLVDLGLLERTADTLPSPAARLACFPQVSGQGGGRDLNVHTLARDAAILIGRVCGAARGEVFVAADLRASLGKADAFAAQIKHLIDTHWLSAPRDGDRPDDWPTPGRRVYRDVAPGGRLRLQSEQISSVIWACGFRPDFGWVKLPIFDPLGFPTHQRGVTDEHGLYFLGLPWLHKWKSATLLGVSDDAEYIAQHIAANRRSRTGANP